MRQKRCRSPLIDDLVSQARAPDATPARWLTDSCGVNTRTVLDLYQEVVGLVNWTVPGDLMRNPPPEATHTRTRSQTRVSVSQGAHYRGTSLIRNSTLLEPCSRAMPRVQCQSRGGGQFFMSEVPLFSICNSGGVRAKRKQLERV